MRWTALESARTQLTSYIDNEADSNNSRSTKEEAMKFNERTWIARRRLERIDLLQAKQHVPEKDAEGEQFHAFEPSAVGLHTSFA